MCPCKSFHPFSPTTSPAFFTALGLIPTFPVGFSFKNQGVISLKGPVATRAVFASDTTSLAVTGSACPCCPVSTGLKTVLNARTFPLQTNFRVSAMVTNAQTIPLITHCSSFLLTILHGGSMKLKNCLCSSYNNSVDEQKLNPVLCYCYYRSSGGKLLKLSRHLMKSFKNRDKQLQFQDVPQHSPSKFHKPRCLQLTHQVRQPSSRSPWAKRYQEMEAFKQTSLQRGILTSWLQVLDAFVHCSYLSLCIMCYIRLFQ